MDLAATSALLRLLSDPTRVRLLALLEREELTVAELSTVLHLAQPRVSTHLAKLKEADLVRDRRAGVSAYYRSNSDVDQKTAALLGALRANVNDSLIADDLRRLPTILAKRAHAEGWADTVAGDMERHYSPAARGKRWRARWPVCSTAATCSMWRPATARWPNCWRRMPNRFCVWTRASAWSPPRRRG